MKYHISSKFFVLPIFQHLDKPCSFLLIHWRILTSFNFTSFFQFAVIVIESVVMPPYLSFMCSLSCLWWTKSCTDTCCVCCVSDGPPGVHQDTPSSDVRWRDGGTHCNSRNNSQTIYRVSSNFWGTNISQVAVWRTNSCFYFREWLPGYS